MKIKSYNKIDEELSSREMDLVLKARELRDKSGFNNDIDTSFLEKIDFENFKNENIDINIEIYDSSRNDIFKIKKEFIYVFNEKMGVLILYYNNEQNYLMITLNKKDKGLYLKGIPSNKEIEMDSIVMKGNIDGISQNNIENKDRFKLLSPSILKSNYAKKSEEKSEGIKIKSDNRYVKFQLKNGQEFKDEFQKITFYKKDTNLKVNEYDMVTFFNKMGNKSKKYSINIELSKPIILNSFEEFKPGTILNVAIAQYQTRRDDGEVVMGNPLKNTTLKIINIA